MSMSDMAMPSLHPESRICHVQWWLSYSVRTLFYLVFPGRGFTPIFEGLGQVDSLLPCNHKVIVLVAAEGKPKSFCRQPLITDTISLAQTAAA